MSSEYPSQRIQDWLSQQWVMFCGRQIDPAEHRWLMGPFGEVDVIGDSYIDRIVRDEGLTAQRAVRHAGLIDSVDSFNLSAPDRARLQPVITAFYEQTARHELDVWSEWSPLFRPFGGMLHRLYSRRLKQLNVPLKPLDTSRGISSEIVKLVDSAGQSRYTIWYRLLKKTGQVIYSGVYTTCVTPAGRTCVKVIFPLPRGNATVVMDIAVDPRGGLVLTSSGDGFGSAGFYFLLRDRKGRHWAQYIRSFRERIHVFVDDEGALRTDHLLTLWRRRVLELHYKITRLAEE